MTALAEKPTSTDLVVIDSDLAHIEATLSTLTDNGDFETLHKVSTEAQAYALYHQRNKSKQQADHFARIKVLAEAGLGIIDLRTPGTRYGKNAAPLLIGDHQIPEHIRATWQMLAIGQLRGLLGRVIERLASDSFREVSTAGVYDELKLIGVAWVQPGFIQAAAHNSGLTCAEIAKRTGKEISTVYNYLSPCHRHKVTRWLAALPIMEGLGIDPRTAPTALRPRGNGASSIRRKQRMERALRDQERAKAAQRHGGNIHEAYSLLRKCAQVLDPAEHDFTTKEAKAHVRSAYSALRRAEDEIAQALGVA